MATRFRRLFNLLPVFVLCLPGIHGQTVSQEMALRESLIGYDINVLPTFNQSERIVVGLNFTFQSLLELNQKQQTVSVSGNLQLSWHSNMLTWSPEQYGGLKRILFKPSEIWTPEITVVDSIKKNPKIGTDEFFVRLQYDGMIVWYPDASIITQCTMDTATYPFDSQTCFISFKSNMYDSDRLLLIAIRAELAMHIFHENGEWEITEHSVKNGSKQTQNRIPADHHGNEITCTIVFKRRIAYHVINTVLPILLLSILNVLVFVLPPEAGEKMSLSITVLLAYAVFLSVFNENMPTTSTTVSLLAIYMVITLAMGTAATSVSAVLLHYCFADKLTGRRFFSIFATNSKCDVNENSSIVNQPDTGHDMTKSNIKLQALKEDITNLETADITDKIDIVSFWTILFLTLVFTLVSFLLMIFGNL